MNMLRSVVLGLFLMACGGSVTPRDGGTDGSSHTDAVPNPDVPVVTDIATFCTGLTGAVIAPICDNLQRCCTATERTEGFLALAYNALCGTAGGPPTSGCTGDLNASVSAGRLRFEPSSAGACLAALHASVESRTSTCGGIGTVTDSNPMDLSIVPECRTALHGLQAEGAGCTHDFECTNGRCADVQYDDHGDVAGDGHCAARAADGGSCSEDAACASGACVNGLCTATVAANGVCDSGQDCNSGLYCAIPPSGGAGRCTMPLAAGSACSDTDSCARGLCEAGVCVEICIGPRDAG